MQPLVLARAAFMYHTDPSGVYQPRRVSVMLECSTGELLPKAAFMRHADKWQYAALKGAGYSHNMEL